jgi:hypothetical protein
MSNPSDRFRREYEIQCRMEEIFKASGINEYYWPLIEDELRAKAVRDLQQQRRAE